MRSTWRPLLFIPFLVLLMLGTYQVQRWRIGQRKAPLVRMTGRPFPVLPLLDSTGQPFKPDFSTASFTLVDAWFRDCPYCLAEMRQFSELPGRDSLRILSISIDPPEEWLRVLRGQDQRWAFLSNPVNNWHHAVAVPVGTGGQSAGQVLADSLGITSYPSFLVVDRMGMIVGVPPSAGEWRGEQQAEKNPFLFLTDPVVWTPWRYLLVVLLGWVLFRQLQKWIRIAR